VVGLYGWYIQSSDLFTQLFSIHAFVQDDTSPTNCKQMPLVFKRSAKYYQAVFQEIVKLLESNDLTARVDTIVCDFESLFEQHVKLYFQTSLNLVVFFHWSQAVLRKLRSLGLQTAYM
jgi:hypothetical protein